VNSRLSTDTENSAWVDVMPTGLSSTTQAVNVTLLALELLRLAGMRQD